jgi:hypothetical protein
MTEDARCCGSGTCIIDTEGRCWCGQQWDGQRMSRPGRLISSQAQASSIADEANAGSGPDADFTSENASPEASLPHKSH